MQVYGDRTMPPGGGHQEDYEYFHLGNQYPFLRVENNPISSIDFEEIRRSSVKIPFFADAENHEIVACSQRKRA